MAVTGVHVKALDTFPGDLLEIDNFYMEMFAITGANFPNVQTYCSLFGFSSEEVLDSVKIMKLIEVGVK